jgi:hypothetical protein
MLAFEPPLRDNRQPPTMRARHRIALACVLAALLVLYGSEHSQPRWFWNGAYWTLLGAAVLTLIRRSRSQRLP